MSATETIAKVAMDIEALYDVHDAPRAIAFSELDWMLFTTDSACLPYIEPYTEKARAPKMLGLPVLILQKWAGGPVPINAKAYEQILDASAAFRENLRFPS